MFFFNRGGDPTASITETVETFKELALPLVVKGDFDGVNRLYAKTYGEVMKRRKSSSLEAVRARAAMERALQDVLTRSARERRHYFDPFGGGWWRNGKRR